MSKAQKSIEASNQKVQQAQAQTDKLKADHTQIQTAITEAQTEQQNILKNLEDGRRIAAQQELDNEQLRQQLALEHQKIKAHQAKLQKAIKNIEARRARQTQRIDELKQKIAKEREVNHGLRETLRQNKAQVLISGT